MARNITDAQRQVTVPFPAKKVNWKRLMVWLIVACVVVGGSIGGYYLYNQVTSIATQPTPPAQPGVTAPATPDETSEPSQPETPAIDPMPVLEVVWEEINLPPLEHGFDEIDGLLVKDGGKTIIVYRVVGPADGGKATLYSVWDTTDGGKTWKEVEQVIFSPGQRKELGFFMPQERSWGGNVRDPYLSEREELVKGTPDPLTDFGPPFLVDRDPNNPDNILVVSWYRKSDGSDFIRPGTPVGRLFLSMNSRWYQMNFHPDFAPYDAFPETPQLTFLKLLPPDILARIISTDDGSVELYMTGKTGDTLWKAIVNSKSPN